MGYAPVQRLMFFKTNQQLLPDTALFSAHCIPRDRYRRGIAREITRACRIRHAAQQYQDQCMELRLGTARAENAIAPNSEPSSPTFVIVQYKGGEPCWVRTSDLLIKSQLLYRLS